MLIPITNKPQHYDWGSHTAISQFLQKEPSGLPEAELWFGTHDGSPTRIADPSAADGHTSLADWVAENCADAGCSKLPFLLKILAAEHPLSLQVHPDTQQAQRGFHRENEAGIPLTSPTRNYKDDQAKPEIIVAISDTFDALAGFRPVEQSMKELSGLGGEMNTALRPLLKHLSYGLREAVEWILLSSASEVEAPLKALVQNVDYTRANTTLRLLAPKYAGDRGLLLALLLRRVTLKRGEALFLPAGNIHAYLHGVGIELMGASDNVLRGGLTSKHVDATELISVLDYEATDDNRLEPISLGSGAKAYQPPKVKFELIRVDGTTSSSIKLNGPAIAVCLNGTTRIQSVKRSISLAAGQCLFITPDEQNISVEEGAEIFFATAPVSVSTLDPVG